MPRFRRHQEAAADRAKLTRNLLESGEATETPQHVLTKPGDTAQMRGIPIYARGVGGVQRGSDPVAELLRRQPREE